MISKVFSLLFLGVGVFLLVQITMPLLSYKLKEVFTQNVALLSPDPTSQVLGASVENIDDFPAFVSHKSRINPAPYDEFYLSIPSIKLSKIKVKVDSNDFNSNLGHLPGSALPGEKGNVFITGHSALPQFYSPTNFKTIFAHLPEVKKGDKIYLEVGGEQFEYLVQNIKTVPPTDLSVLDPPSPGGRYLSLMTCVPPGLYLKRLIVIAQKIE